jgi:peptide/nickel transport system substrate-binding protein
LIVPNRALARIARKAVMRFRAFTFASAALLALALTSGTPADRAGDATLVVARLKDAVVLDPSHAVDLRSHDTAAEVLQNLVAFKPGSFEIVGDAARSWSVSRDGKTWTFELVPGLVFSDSTPLDAAAVKFNFDRWRLRSHPSHGTYSYSYYAANFGGFPGLISDVRAPTQTRVVISLTKPLGPFLRDIAEAPFGIGSPRAIAADPDAYESAPVGSGPYAVAEWVRGDHVTLRANPRYAGPKPGYGTVVLRAVPVWAHGVRALRRGEVDVLTDPRPADAEALAAGQGMAIAHQPSNNVAYLALNVERKPFGDVRVRRAVAYALDKVRLMARHYAGGAVVADNWTPPGMPGESAAVKAYPHDVARAKALLAAAGFPHGFATTLWYSTAPQPDLPEPQRLAAAFRADLREAGITVTLRPYELRGFLAAIKHGRHDMCLIDWTGDNGDPDNFFYPVLDQDAAQHGSAMNYSFWREPRFHALMLAGRNTVDERARAAIYRRANQLVHDEVPAVPLVHTSVPLVLKSALAGFVPSPNTSYHFELIHPPAALSLRASR